MTTDEITALAESLEDSASEHSRRAFSDRCVSPDCALASNLAEAAATALRDQQAKIDLWMAQSQRTGAVAELAQARLAKAVEALRRVDENEHEYRMSWAAELARATLAEIEASHDAG